MNTLPLLLYMALIAQISVTKTLHNASIQKRSVEQFFVKRAGANPEGSSNEKGKASRRAGQLTIKPEHNFRRMTGKALKQVGNVLSCRSGADCSPRQPSPRSLAVHLSKSQLDHTPSVSPSRSPSHDSSSSSLGKAEPSRHKKKASLSNTTSMNAAAVEVAQGVFAPPDKKASHQHHRLDTSKLLQKIPSPKKEPTSPKEEHESPKKGSASMSKSSSFDDNANHLARGLFAPKDSTSSSSSQRAVNRHAPKKLGEDKE